MSGDVEDNLRSDTIRNLIFDDISEDDNVENTGWLGSETEVVFFLVQPVMTSWTVMIII